MSVDSRLAKFFMYCVKAIIGLGVVGCLALCVACGGSVSSTGSDNANSDAASGQSTTNEQKASETTSSVKGAGKPSGGEIDSRFVGEWTGNDVYTMSDVNDIYVLRDNGDWANLVVNADGTASFEGEIGGTALSFANLHLEKGTKGYLVYDGEGGLFGSLEYDRAGTTDWLILGIPDDEVGMVCYTFFINNR